MTYRISKTFEFSAAHQLRGLPEAHPCSRLHGHNYTARVEIEADNLDRHGFVVDYRELAPFKAWVDERLDHRYLNDVSPFAGPNGDNPTAELLSQYLRGVVLATCPVPDGASVAVHVSETGKTWAVWLP